MHPFRQKNQIVSQNRQPQRQNKHKLNFSLSSRIQQEVDLKYDQDASRFGTKRSYSDKQNQLPNLKSDYSAHKASEKPLIKSFLESEQKQKLSKKYAYIKNTNSLIHSNHYSPQNKNINNFHHDQDSQIIRRRQNFNHNTVQKQAYKKASSEKQTQQKKIMTKDQQIYHLKQSLQHQKDKFQQFQQQTINNQFKILQTINDLEYKLKQINSQNAQIRQQNKKLITLIQKRAYQQFPNVLNQESFYQNNSFHPNSQNSQLFQLKYKFEQSLINFQSLEQDYKKIKGVGRGLVDMMKKVDQISSPPGQDEVKYAWKWVKKVVWEYEAIRKKASQWKKAYDQLNKDSQEQCSVSSEQTS